MENWKITLLTLTLFPFLGNVQVTASASSRISFVSASETVVSPTDTLGKYLDELSIVSASVHKNLTSSSALHTINSTDIDKLGITNLTDAINRIPGVVLRDHGGFGSLKTISVRGLGTQHTGVSYDGVPLSDVQSGQIDLSRYSMDNIENLTLKIGDNEDIFVPARTAASAASLIISSQDKNTIQAKDLLLMARIKGGSFGYINPTLRLGKSIGKDVCISFSGDYTHSKNNYPYTIPNGNEPAHKRRRNSHLDSGHAEGNIFWDPDAFSTLSAKFYYYQSFQHLPGPAILYTDNAKESLRENNLFAQLQYRRKLSSAFSLSAYMKYNRSYTRYQDINGKYPEGKLDNRYRQQEAYATCALLYTPLPSLALDYSADYFYNNLISNLKEYNHPHRNSILQSLSVKYSVWRLIFTARGLLSIYADTPGHGFSSRTSSRISPSASISLRPIADQLFFVRLNYKNIFRMPSFNELYFDHYGSIRLKPETTDQFNLGLTYGISNLKWLSHFNLTVDAYFNRIKDKIVAVPYNMFVWTMTNMGHVSAYGLDVSLNASFPLTREQSIVVSGNYSLQKALGRTSVTIADWNKQLPYTPVNSGAFSIAWENPWISVNVRGNGCGERFSTKENLKATRLDPYWEFGAALYHTFAFKGHELELRADLLNIFDTRYEIVAHYPMPGRSWQASLTFRL